MIRGRKEGEAAAFQKRCGNGAEDGKEMEAMPEDLLCEIFLRLPLKSIALCQSVCCWLRRFVKSNSFMGAYGLASIHKQQHTTHLFFNDHIPLEGECKAVGVLVLETLSTYPLLFPRNSRVRLPHNCSDSIASFNGFVYFILDGSPDKETNTTHVFDLITNEVFGLQPMTGPSFESVAAPSDSMPPPSPTRL